VFEKEELFSVNADQFFEVNADMIIPNDQKEAFRKDRTGAIAGKTLAQRFGWRDGDKVHLQGALFQFDPELTLRGIYEGGADDGGSLFFQFGITPTTLLQGMIFAAFVGILGGGLPARRAARTKLIEALRD